MIPRICIDIDNVIAQTDEVMRDVIREYTDGHVTLGYDHVQTFEYHECKDADGHRITQLDWKVIHNLFAERSRILSVKPYPFVQARLRELSDSFAIHLATSRLPKARQTTVEWLDRNCFDFKYDLHFVQHREKHASLGQFTAAVEDDYEQAKAFASDVGTPCLLMRHPWNEKRPQVNGVEHVDDWTELTEKLLRSLPSA